MNMVQGVVMEGRLMNESKENPYALAGWLAIAGAVLVLPAMVLGIILDVLFQKNGSLPGGLPFVYFVIGICQALFAVYAFYRFRDLLNERYNFHETDTLITIIMLGIMAITAVGFTGRIVGWSGAQLPAVIVSFALLILIGIPLSIISIIFAVKLLKLPTTFRGLLKPFVFLSIAASGCFLLIILAPLGLLISAASDIVLGLILLRPASEADHPEFV